MVNNMDIKTKIVATLGPSSDSYETIKALLDAGLDLARINMSHGKWEEHKAKIDVINKLKEDGYLLGIMMDLKGPKIRCGTFENDGIELTKGDIIRIVKEDVIGNKERFSVSYKGLYDDLNVNDIFTFDDGLLGFKVISKEEPSTLVCEVQNNYYLKNRKGLNAPYIKLMNDYMSEKDRNDIELLCKEDVNFVAASFVRRKEDVIEIRRLLAKYGRDDIKVVSKIESPEGVENIDDILEVSNAVMVARGDLGVEVDLTEVPNIQKELIHKCNLAGKPVIVATHMLDSMQTNPRPTRAEVSDVFNAILDGADAVMLSGESATGKYPIESVKTQDQIARKAEEILDYEKFANEFYEASNKSQGDAIGISVSKSALMLDAKLIVMFSHEFSAVRKLSKFKIKAPIVAFVNDKASANSLNGLYYGINPIYSNKTIINKEEYANKIAKQYGVKKGETIILVGVNEENNKADTMKIMQVK